MVWTGCIDQVSFNADRSGGKLVVSGSITNQGGPYELELGMTTAESTLPAPVSGASVILFNNHGMQETYNEVEPGLYILQGDIIRGTGGDTYYIEIQLADGRRFKSIPEKLPLRTANLNVQLETGTFEEETTPGTVIETQGIFIYTDTEIPENDEPLFLKWDVESLYLFLEAEPLSAIAPPAKLCYVTEPIRPQEITLFTSTDFGSLNINRQLLGIKQIISYQFYIRHYIIVTVSSVTERRYDYWQKADRVINQTGTIFDITPANIFGNILNENGDTDDALGYFEAVAVNSARDYVVRADLPVFIPNPCPQSNFNSHFACNNCLKIENSSLERPQYLPD